jgi:LacI family transcriptional regulator
VDSGRYSGVFSDNELGAYLATKHLLSLGHRKIGCVTGPMGAASSKNRLFGYIRALQEAELPFDGALVREGNYHIDTGFEFGCALIDAGATAIFAFNDMMAYGVYRAASVKGVSVPGELSIVGYDDLPFSEIAEPPLTSVRQGAYEIGVEAVNAIVRQITEPETAPQNVTLRPELVVRKSTARVRKGS